MLAQATGIYRARPAAGPLCDHFACAWVHPIAGIADKDDPRRAGR